MDLVLQTHEEIVKIPLFVPYLESRSRIASPAIPRCLLYVAEDIKTNQQNDRKTIKTNLHECKNQTEARGGCYQLITLTYHCPASISQLRSSLA